MASPSAYRWTMIFNYVSGETVGTGFLNLKGGWSESVYANGGGSATLSNFLILCASRALLLPVGSYISGYRVQGVDPSSGANTGALNYPGGGSFLTNPQDIPQMALLLRVLANGRTNIRSMRLAAIPDSQISFGEYRPTVPFQAAMNVYLTNLTGWAMRVQDLSQPIYPIATIDAFGNVVLTTPYATTLGTAVKIKRTIDAFGNQKGIKTFVQSITDTTHFKVQPWPFGACTLGSLQPYVIVYPGILANSTNISRAVVRKIGRPSLGYRGRRSKRKA